MPTETATGSVSSIPLCSPQPSIARFMITGKNALNKTLIIEVHKVEYLQKLVTSDFPTGILMKSNKVEITSSRVQMFVSDFLLEKLVQFEAVSKRPETKPS